MSAHARSNNQLLDNILFIFSCVDIITVAAGEHRLSTDSLSGASVGVGENSAHLGTPNS